MKPYAVFALPVVVVSLMGGEAFAAGPPNLQALPAGTVVTSSGLSRELCLSQKPSVAGAPLPNGTFLKFSATSWNSGPGVFELVAGKPNPNQKKQKVFQRIYSSDGSYKDYLAGFFVWHPAHNHFHFEDYAHYVLQPVNAPGASARIAVKTTFCIYDTTQIVAGSTRKYLSCGNTIQGLSVGWGDTYGYILEGQQIDVSGLPGSGQYRLDIIVDPKNRIIETSDADNTSEFMIERLDALPGPC